jgi:predicted nucleic acid-binding Zn ribbon protein
MELPTEAEIAQLVEETSLDDPAIFDRLDAMLAEEVAPARERTCEACGKAIAPGRRADARTCSSTCRCRLWRDRAASATAGSDI